MSVGVSSPNRGFQNYKLTLRGKRGLPIRPLVFGPKPDPLPGESLRGLVARTAHRNGFDGIQRVLRLADIGALRSEAVATVHALAEGAAERLAFVLNVELGEINSRCHPRVEQGAASDLIDFNGVVVRASHRETRLRRVSPISLGVSAHHRSIWDLLPFSFCPESMEALIDACPICRTPLRWRRTVGVAFCETCVDDEGDPTVDLRDHPGRVFEVEDPEALRLATGIVDPDPARRQVARAHLPSPFHSFADGEVFETIVALACAVATDPTTPRAIQRRMHAAGDFARITPDALGKAARAILDWPRGFHELADGMRSLAKDRRGHYGVRKEVGPLLMLARDRHLHPGIKTILRREIDANMATTGSMDRVRRADNHREPGWLTAQAASNRFGVDRRMLGRLARHPGMEVRRIEGARRSPILFPEERLERIVAERRDLMPAASAAIVLGIPASGVADLTHAGLVRRVEGPVLAMACGGVQYSAASVEEMRRRVLAKAGACLGAGEGVIRLGTAAKRLGMGVAPWSAIVTAVLSGDLPTCMIAGVEDAMAARVGVLGMRDLSRVAELAGPPSGDPIEDDYVNREEAAFLLGTTALMVASLVDAGMMERTGATQRNLLRADVLAFRETYVLGGEIARRLGIRTGEVRSFLAARGVVPIASVRNERGWVWRRNEVRKVV